MNEPTVTMQAVNAAVRALEKRDRAAAIALLERFAVITTPQLRPEQYQAVLEAFEAALSGSAPT
jgi:hypothetical protein